MAAGIVLDEVLDAADPEPGFRQHLGLLGPDTLDLGHRNLVAGRGVQEQRIFTWYHRRHGSYL
jgi:hypothetical protein